MRKLFFYKTTKSISSPTSLHNPWNWKDSLSLKQFLLVAFLTKKISALVEVFSLKLVFAKELFLSMMSWWNDEEWFTKKIVSGYRKVTEKGFVSSFCLFRHMIQLVNKGNTRYWVAVGEGSYKSANSNWSSNSSGVLQLPHCGTSFTSFLLLPQ